METASSGRRRMSSLSSKKACVPELLRLVRRHPMLYNPLDANHRKSSKTRLVWRAILQELRSMFSAEELAAAKLDSVNAVQCRYRNLKNSYDSNKRRRELDPTGTKPWIWAEHMSFVDNIEDSFQDDGQHNGFPHNGHQMDDYEEGFMAMDEGQQQDFDDSGVEEYRALSDLPEDGELIIPEDNEAMTIKAKVFKKSRPQAKKATANNRNRKNTNTVSPKMDIKREPFEGHSNSFDGNDACHAVDEILVEADPKRDEDGAFGCLVSQLMKDVKKEEKHQLRIDILALIGRAAGKRRNDE